MPEFKPNHAKSYEKKIPKIDHPSSTPDTLIYVEFVFQCLFKILGFALIYGFLVVTVPISLIVKLVSKLLAFARLKYRDVKANYGNAWETFWFLSDGEGHTANLILLCTVNGSLSSERLQNFLHERFLCKKEREEEFGYLRRLRQKPERVFRELIWLDKNANYALNVTPVDMDSACIKTCNNTIMDIQHMSSCKEWQVFLYAPTRENQSTEKCFIMLRFRHTLTDLHNLADATSKCFRDQQVSTSCEKMSMSRSFCFGMFAFFEGPIIFLKSLFKSKDSMFASPFSKRALVYAEPIRKSDVDIVTTATGASVCDVILSCLAGSLRTCMRSRGKNFPNDVLVYFPVHLDSGRSLRCFTSFNIFSLPVATEGAIPRLWETQLRRNNTYSIVEAITSRVIVQLAFLILPSCLARRLVQSFVTKASCTINCILEDSLDDLRIDGRPVENFIPMEDKDDGLSITIIQYKGVYQMAALMPSANDYAIHPSELCAEFVRQIRKLSVRFKERARAVRARGQKVLSSRRNSVFVIEEDEEKIP